jgi:hypothetical protein
VVAVSDPSVPTTIEANTTTILIDDAGRIDEAFGLAARSAAQASLVIAITIPASTKMTISTCIQIQKRGTPQS